MQEHATFETLAAPTCSRAASAMRRSTRPSFPSPLNASDTLSSARNRA